MHKFNFSTGILSPINSDISLNDASIISSGSLPSSVPFDESETSSVFESVKNDSKLDSFHKRSMKESTAAVDMSKDKRKKNINVEKEVKFKESYEMLKQSMDELVYKYTPSSVLSPVSNDADVQKVLEAKNIFQTSILSPISNDADVEKEAEPKDILPEIKNDKNTHVLKSKILRKSGSAESKSSQHSNSKSQKKKDSNARNSKVIENNQQSKCTDPPQKSQKEAMKKNLKRLELQPEGKEAAKLNSSVTELQNPKDSKKISSSVHGHEISAGSGSKENLKHFYTQKQKKSTVSNSQSITEIENLSIEKSIEITMSMEMDRLRGFILDQNMSIRKDLIILHETVKRQNDVIGYLFSTIEDLKAENKRLVSRLN